MLLPQDKRITHVVNCTYGFSQIPNFHEKSPKGDVKYFVFPVSHWQRFIRDNKHQAVLAFVEPLFRFIEVSPMHGPLPKKVSAPPTAWMAVDGGGVPLSL